MCQSRNKGKSWILHDVDEHLVQLWDKLIISIFLIICDSKIFLLLKLTELLLVAKCIPIFIAGIYRTFKKHFISKSLLTHRRLQKQCREFHSLFIQHAPMITSCATIEYQNHKTGIGTTDLIPFSLFSYTVLCMCVCVCVHAQMSDSRQSSHLQIYVATTTIKMQDFSISTKGLFHAVHTPCTLTDTNMFLASVVLSF